MGVSSAILWWEEWQLRILVLGSLFIQFLICFTIWIRRVASLRRLRVLAWIAFIGADALAIYALATLFNRRKQTWDGESSAMEVLWAPVLLIHLGGQLTVSAYSLEDNELWKRHTVTLVSQITVALYVFWKSWCGEKTLLAAAVLLFVVGILKFAQKPWALRTASFNSMQASSTVSMPATPCEEETVHEHIYSLQEYVLEAKKCVSHITAGTQYWYEAQSNYMFVDRSAPYSVRIRELSSVLKLEYKHAYSTLQACLGSTFDMLYTRQGSFDTYLGTSLLFLLPFLVLASVLLFVMSNKDGQNESDVMVTYILFCCTTMLEFFIPFVGLCQMIGCCTWLHKHLQGWHGMVSQHNLISFCVRKKKPTFVMRLSTFNFLRDSLNQHWYIQQVHAAFQITEMVHQHVLNGWKNCIQDDASYKRFNDLRGQWALRRHRQLGWSLKKPFDETVLTWHIATDLCFYHSSTSPQGRRGEATEHSREISNYMICLLLIRPEMLMPGSRSDLFTLVSDQIIEDSKGPLSVTEEILAKEILNMPMLSTAANMISSAVNLAKGLIELRDEKERWTVIQGVWVEMLCYSASRCRGYLHAKSLGEGGEYLSYIWLLLSFLGMETLADRHQYWSDPQDEEEHENAYAYASYSQGRASQSADDYNPV
ncbi:hypothetical protein ACQ4PT_000922 [Festuca glaucescens]